jgi:acyl-CoA reductase-like NAD-dependent aldehyde dehydrogenase
VLSAYRAFREYRKFSVQKRRKILDDVRESLEKEKHNLIELLVIEGYPLKLAEEEYTRMLACVSHESLNYFERETMEMLTKNGDETVIGVRRPHGVVCVSPPRNPSSIAFMACLSLFAGNTLVLKPSASMPMFSIYLWKNIFGTILNENGAPKGTINIVMGDSRQFVQEWMSNPYVKCIFYFSDEGLGEGPFGGGDKHILRSSRGDSMVVWKDAPVEEAAEAALDCFISSSRMSMAPRKIFIHEEMYAPFMEVFSRKLQALKVGLPRDPETILSPAENEMSGFFEHLDETLRSGGDLLSGGYRVNYLGEKDPEGLFIAPTVIDVPVERYDLLKGVAEKTSFPVLSVFKIKSRQPSEREKDHEIYDQMVHLLEQSADGLRASVWVRSPYYLRKFIEDLNQSGAVRFNSRYTDSFPYLFAHGMGQLGGLFEEMNQVWQKTSHLQWISITRLSLENSQVRVAVREA